MTDYMRNRYSVNQTMRLLGMQPVLPPGMKEMIDDICEAYPASFYDNYSLIADAMHAGIILGKRAERSRRKKVSSR